MAIRPVLPGDKTRLTGPLVPFSADPSKGPPLPFLCEESMTFQEKCETAAARNNSLVCVGLDPSPERMPPHLSGKANPIAAFLKEIVAATQDLVCAYKPNFAFFGAQGISGWQALEETLAAIPEDVPVILDFKAGDIGNTAAQYARMAYDILGVDAVTVNPLMGTDAVDPFIAYTDRCAFILCLTSNPGSADFQRLKTDQGTVYQALARKAVTWNQKGPCGLVVGATHPGELKQVRDIATDLPFLIPGVGSQGGDAEAVVQNGCTASGGGILVNASRSILYASSETDFADAARKATSDLRDMLNSARK